MDIFFAYIGPGAGIALVGSFLAVLIAMLSAMVTLLTWPVTPTSVVMLRVDDKVDRTLCGVPKLFITCQSKCFAKYKKLL